MYPTVLRMEAKKLLISHLDQPRSDQEMADPRAMPWHWATAGAVVLIGIHNSHVWT